MICEIVFPSFRYENLNLRWLRASSEQAFPQQIRWDWSEHRSDHGSGRQGGSEGKNFFSFRQIYDEFIFAGEGLVETGIFTSWLQL